MNKVEKFENRLGVIIMDLETYAETLRFELDCREITETLLSAIDKLEIVRQHMENEIKNNEMS